MFELAGSLKQYRSRLKEVLDAIERQDMSAAEIRASLEELSSDLKKLRQSIPTRRSNLPL